MGAGETTGNIVGADGWLPTPQSRVRMSGLDTSGELNLIDYRDRFIKTYLESNPTATKERAYWKYEEWCCTMKDYVIRASGIKFRPYQKEFSDKIVVSLIRNDGEMFLSEWARQSGKTETLASTGYALSILFAPIRIGIFAPKLRQAHILWNRLKNRYNQDILNSLGISIEKFGGETFSLSNDSVVQAITCGSGNIEGETFDIIFTDETQKIARRMLLSEIWPMGTETNATRICIGTPKFSDCWFREQVERLRDTSRCMINDWRVAARYSQNYRDYVEKMMKEMGPESDEFRTQFELEWILEKGMFVTERHWDRLKPPMGLVPYVTPEDIEMNDEYAKWHITTGIDVAKSPDSTVVTIAGQYLGDWEPYHSDLSEETIILLDVMELHGENYDDQVDVISDFLRKWRVEHGLVDSTGVGDPVTDIVNSGVRPPIEGFRFTGTNKHALYKHAEKKVIVDSSRQFADYVIPQELRLGPDHSREMRRMRKQWLKLEKEYKGSVMSVHHPDEKDARDDYPDSGALAMWAIDGDYEQEEEKTMTSTNPMLGSV